MNTTRRELLKLAVAAPLAAVAVANPEAYDFSDCSLDRIGAKLWEPQHAFVSKFGHQIPRFFGDRSGDPYLNNFGNNKSIFQQWKPYGIERVTGPAIGTHGREGLFFVDLENGRRVALMSDSAGEAAAEVVRVLDLKRVWSKDYFNIMWPVMRNPIPWGRW
jgi:hypothetical protein